MAVKSTTKRAPAKAIAPAKRQISPTRGNTDKNTHSWLDLQDELRACETSAEAEVLLKAELKGPARMRWMTRIHGRRSFLRNIEELAALQEKAKE